MRILILASTLLLAACGHVPLAPVDRCTAGSELIGQVSDVIDGPGFVEAIAGIMGARCAVTAAVTWLRDDEDRRAAAGDAPDDLSVPNERLEHANLWLAIYGCRSMRLACR